MLGRRLSPGEQGRASFTPATTRRRCPTKVRPKARRESLGHGRSSKARACTPLARWSLPGCERCLSGWPRPLRALASAWSAIYIERRLQALHRSLPVDPTALADVWKFLAAGDGVGAIDTIGFAVHNRSIDWARGIISCRCVTLRTVSPHKTESGGSQRGVCWRTLVPTAFNERRIRLRSSQS